MAQSFGKKISCGKDGLYSFHFTCTGPDCSILKGFPVATCTTEGEVLACDNGVTCDEQTALLVSEFTYTQEGEAFYMDRKIRFPHCEFSVATGSNLTEPFFHSDTCGTFTTNATTVIPSVAVSRPTGSVTQPGLVTPTASGGWLNTTATASTTEFSPKPSNIEEISRGSRHRFSSSLLMVLLFFSLLINAVSCSAVAFGDSSLILSELPALNNELERRAQYNYKESMEKFKDIWKDWYEGKLKDIITGEAGTEEIIDFFTGGFVDEIQETACSEVFNLFLDPALEHVEYDKLFKWVLEPFTSQCARKVRRFARKFRKSAQARLAIVFAGSLTCSMLEDAVVDNLVPMHPDKLKEQMSDLVCGGDSEEDCNKKDLLNDPVNCGECKRQCSNGEKCIHGICSLQYCNGMLFGSNSEPCSTECQCTSTQWGTGVCVIQETCDDDVLNECESHDDCDLGEICGMASGCDIFKCLDGKSCVGQGPWLIPDEPTPSPTPTESSPVPSSPIPDITSPTAAPGTVGWILTLHSEEPTNYWINDWSEKDIFLNSNGRKTVRTRCVTIEETSYAALLPDGTKIEPDGNFLGFDSTPDDGPNACCFAWFADDKCSEISGKSGKICGDGSAEFDFPVMSWKVDGCNGWWTGPPQ